jgi:phenylacetate-CoA ligase
MGANIYPEDVEQALFVDVAPSDVEHIGSFCLEIVEAADATPRPCVHVEADEPSDDALAGRLAARIRERLVANSADFRASAAEDPADGAVVVRLHAPATGPFEGNATRIKRRYLVDLAAGAEAS